MGRTLRAALGGFAYHVFNRGNGRAPLFKKRSDFEAFERTLGEALDRVSARLLAYCLLPNYWHLVLWPKLDGELSDFMHWLTLTHAQRWRAQHRDVGSGHLYQGRYKSFPVQGNEHLLTVLRHVERGGLRAGLAAKAEEWRWGSLWHRLQDDDDEMKNHLSPWPVACPPNWAREVNKPQTEAELAAVLRSIERGQPFGGEIWTKRTSKLLGLESTLRPRGRPKKTVKKGS